MALAKKNRLVSKRDFEGVFKNGKIIKGAFFVMRFTENKDDQTKIGVVVGLKVSKKATDRNRIKRVATETAGQIMKNSGNYKLVIIANTKAANQKKEQLRQDLLEMAKKQTWLK